MTLVKLVYRVLRSLVVVALALAMVLTPLLGVWLASSLVAYFGGPRELAVVGGLLLFPLLPLIWEARGQRRFRRKVEAAAARGRDPPRAILRTFDRVVVRTLLLNGAFLVALLAWFPKPSFTALATRGDWFLGGRNDATSQQVREGLFASAQALEWLHELANPNPYKHEGDDVPAPKDVKPIDERRPEPRATDERWAVGGARWPMEETLHPAVVAMTADKETSISSVATHLAQAERDPFLRVKALHDWTVSRLHYDHDSVTGVRKPQDAESVFKNRMGVCEGYARLMVELGKFAGVPIAFVVGEVREPDGALAPVGHAWNAVQVGGAWYFLDATWDDPSKAGADAGDPASSGQSNYQSLYLFTPPSVAIIDHLPEDPRWQLLQTPIDRGAFLRQPVASPGFAKLGLTLKRPDRPLIDASGQVELEVDNPRGLHLMATVVPMGATGSGAECAVSGTTTVVARCAVGTGRYDVRLFANQQRFGSYGYVASVGVNGT